MPVPLGCQQGIPQQVLGLEPETADVDKRPPQYRRLAEDSFSSVFFLLPLCFPFPLSSSPSPPPAPAILPSGVLGLGLHRCLKRLVALPSVKCLLPHRRKLIFGGTKPKLLTPLTRARAAQLSRRVMSMPGTPALSHTAGFFETPSYVASGIPGSIPAPCH